MELRKLCNERLGIVEKEQVVALISDRNEVIIQPPYLNLDSESLNLFWNLVNFVRGDDI